MTTQAAPIKPNKTPTKPNKKRTLEDLKREFMTQKAETDKLLPELKRASNGVYMSISAILERDAPKALDLFSYYSMLEHFNHTSACRWLTANEVTRQASRCEPSSIFFR